MKGLLKDPSAFCRLYFGDIDMEEADRIRQAGNAVALQAAMQ